MWQARAVLAAIMAVAGAMPAAANPFGCARIEGTVLDTGAAAQSVRATYKAPATPLDPPRHAKAAFVAYMAEARGDDPVLAAARWDRVQQMVSAREVWRDKEIRAMLVTAREEFVRTLDRPTIYAPRFQHIGCGVTITDPPLVGRMTAEIDVQPGDTVLEIGTGSGYQSAILAALTDKVYTIEIIPPLGRSTDAIQAKLAEGPMPEFKRIRRKIADGYYGWAEAAPFDKIIVTAGIDHVPPPLLQQLKIGGVMVIPIGTPAKQAVLKITKSRLADGSVAIKREDIYADHPTRRGGGVFTTFVPFTKQKGGGTTAPRFGAKEE